MARPNFFCDIEALNCLLQTEFEGDFQDIELTFDLIELPYYFLFSGNESTWTMKVIARGEIYSHDCSGIEAGKLTVDKVSEEGQVEANSQSLAQNMGAFFQACRNISSYIQQQNLEDVYADFDPEEKGILLSVENGKLTHKVVAGKERPEMMCTTLFGGTVMCRPYMDDFWERSMRESMPLEKKTKEAEAGDTGFMEELAQLYLNGSDETAADPVQAVYWYRKLAEAGVSNGMFNLGLHYAKGHGVVRDFAQAAYWMSQAAEHGDNDAPALFEKYTKAAAAQEKIASGDAQAQADLAGVLMALAGSLEQAGPGSDYEEAFALAQKSAAQNNGDGLWTLALAYEHGRGTKPDKEKAVECYRKGAEIGHAPSQHSLACYYMRGEIVGLNQEHGFELVQKSAEQGYHLAVRDMGTCYQFGNGVVDDMKLAIQWYEKYLETNFDPELEHKVAVFKMLDEGGSFDLEGEEDTNDNIAGCSDLPDGFDEMIDLIMFADENGYEDNGSPSIEDQIAFVEKLARDGNAEAQEILDNYHRTNG